MEAKKNNDKKLHFISSEELILICLALSLKVSLKGYKQYFSVGLDEQDKSFIDYVKAKASKSQELEGEKKKYFFMSPRKKPQNQTYMSLAELYSVSGYCWLNPGHAEVNWSSAIDFDTTKFHFSNNLCCKISSFPTMLLWVHNNPAPTLLTEGLPWKDECNCCANHSHSSHGRMRMCQPWITLEEQTLNWATKNSEILPRLELGKHCWRS